MNRTMETRLTSVEACQIVGYDRNRLNEAIAAGSYVCAPPTTAGKARMWSFDDLVPLAVFVIGVEDGLGWRDAGLEALKVSRSTAAEDCVVENSGIVTKTIHLTALREALRERLKVSALSHVEAA